MATVTITDQERSLLNLIAEGESTPGVDPYISLYPSTSEPALVQMTLSEVLRFQQQRIDQGHRSSACGRYQFIKRTLGGAIDILGVDPLTTCYTPNIQDALILAILKRYRGLDDWIAGSLSTDRFMIKLAQEFASFPVPYAMQGHRRQVQKGETYYAGDGLNRALHDPDTLFQQLNDIKAGGTGEISEIDVNSSGPSGARPVLGDSPRTQVSRSAAGAGVGNVPGTGRPGAQPAVNRANLPGGNAVYVYEAIDPLDDRYDFRTGKKVKDILIHGTNAAAASPVTMDNVGPANVAATNTGVAPVEGADPDALDPRGRNQIPTDVTTSTTQTSREITTTVETSTGPQDLTREQIAEGQDAGTISTSAAQTALQDIVRQEQEARAEVSQEVQDAADPDAADPRGRNQIPTETQQNQILEGNAPQTPAPAPTQSPCVTPVTVNTTTAGSTGITSNGALDAFGGAGANINDDLTRTNESNADTEQRLGIDPRGLDQRNTPTTQNVSKSWRDSGPI
jgi:hypothetical protein